MSRFPILLYCIVSFVVYPGFDSTNAEENWLILFDGTSLADWEINERPDSWSLQDCALVAHGKRSHIFYMGPDTPFVNFELIAEVYTERGSNGGIYFLTHYQENGWPQAGFEAQINNSYFIDPKKTGSLYGIDNVWFRSPAKDNRWFTYSILVVENNITIRIDNEIVTEHQVELRPTSGTIALQAHDRRSVVKYRDIRLRRIE